MIVCFDTSAINQLLDDPQQTVIRAALREKYQTRVTALNVVEIAKTKNATRREALRQLEFELSSNEPPFELPNEMLMAYTRALVARTGEMRVTIADERKELWFAMAHADAVTAEAQAEILRWTADLDASRARGAAALRAAVDEKFSSPVDRPANPVRLLRQFMLRENWQHVYWLPARVIKEETGKVLAASRLDELLTASPGFWSVYLVATVLQMYPDAFWHKRHGRRSRVGLLDLWAGMYLPLCDRFVTYDFDQRDALRIMNVFSRRRPRAHVLNWSKFREHLLSAG